MNRLALIALAGLSLTACAADPQHITDAQTKASLQCQYDLAGDNENYDPLFLLSGLPAVDADGNPYGLSLVGDDAYSDCMAGKGFEVADGKLVKPAS